ncbi:MAG TPA: hypothetical protein PLK37_06895 [Terricaulis sp.]|nr:hypothetical protein [Terricaulis sp.]
MRRKRGGRAAGAFGALLIAAVLVTLTGFGAAAFLLRAPPTDPETLCRTDAPLAAHTIILVDSTDRLEPRHKRRLRAVLGQERARLGQYERLTLMRLSARRPQEPAILFSRCLPRPPEQTNPLFENARHTQARWDADFAEALERALGRASAGGAAQRSPILAGLRAIAADPDFDPLIPRRRLVLVSDLLEHEPGGFTHYADGANFIAWRAQATQNTPDFSRVEIRLAPLDRPAHAARQAYALENFWPDYFDAAQARAVSVDPAA